MRVVHVTPASPFDNKAGGVENILWVVLPLLKKEGMEPALIGIERYGDNNKSDKAGDHKNFQFDFLPVLKTERERGFAIRFYLGILFKSRKIIKKGDIIHVHRFEPLPFLILHRNPVVVTLHHNVALDLKLRKGAFVSRIYSLFERLILPNIQIFGVKKILFVSNRLRREFVGKYPNLENISMVVRGGIADKFKPILEDPRCAVRKRYGFKDSDIIVFSAGRLTGNKNVELILEAFKMLEDRNENAMLLIGGIGESRECLENRSKELCIKRVKFLGKIPDEDIQGIYCISDVFVVASTYEGGPLTLYEALSCGCPVVSTNVGAAPDAIENGVTGFVVDEYSSKALFDKIVDVADNRERYRNNVVKRKYNFGMGYVAEKYSEVYSEINRT